MTKIFLTLFVLLSIVACGKTGGGGGSAAEVASATTPADSTDTSNPIDTSTGYSSLPNEAYTFGFNVNLINMSSSNEAKLQKSMDLVARVIATKAFRDGILNHTYNGVKTFVDNGGYSNAQIYKKILDAAEKLFPAKNNKMDMEIELYTDTSSNTVGYTNPSTVRIWMNTKYFNNYTATGATANLTHEWLHKVGFGHAVSYSTSRDYSVPYAIGRLMSKIAATLD